MVPLLELPPVTPLTCQVTWELPLFCTVAVNFWVPPAVNDAVAGETLTVITAAVRVTCAEADLVSSAFETAEIVPDVRVPRLAGARYRPESEIVPREELPPLEPFTCQSTEVSLLLVT